MNQPAAADDVTIPANVASGNYPIIGTGTANAKTITMAAGAGTAPSLTVSGGTLTVAAAVFFSLLVARLIGERLA